MGFALEQFDAGDEAASYLAHNAWSGTDEYPAALFFDEAEALTEIERIAVELCEGRVCDVGAAAGAHALLLQSKGLTVTAVDSSPRAVEVMRRRGVAHPVRADYRSLDWSAFDTALFMMNGIGLVGDRAGLAALLERVAGSGVTMLFDASEPEVMAEQLGPPRCALPTPGQVRFQLEIDGQFGAGFDWLYIGFEDVRQLAIERRWQADLLASDDAGRYLARLTER